MRMGSWIGLEREREREKMRVGAGTDKIVFALCSSCSYLIFATFVLDT